MFRVYWCEQYKGRRVSEHDSLEEAAAAIRARHKAEFESREYENKHKEECVDEEDEEANEPWTFDEFMEMRYTEEMYVIGNGTEAWFIEDVEGELTGAGAGMLEHIRNVEIMYSNGLMPA